MNEYYHSYFGKLDTTTLKEVDVIWERSFSLNNATFDISLWVSINTVLETTSLDAFAKLLQNLPELDIYARQQLIKMLLEDKSYIEFHIEELKLAEYSDTISQLLTTANNESISTQAFTNAMQLTGIGLWLDVPSFPLVIMDYMIDPENSDEILAVKLTTAGQLVAIDWES